MPIFEYICQECHRLFEALVLGSRQPECPYCHSRELRQQLSAFSVGASRSTPASPGCAAAST